MSLKEIIFIVISKSRFGLKLILFHSYKCLPPYLTGMSSERSLLAVPPDAIK